ncbi:MAG: prepilin-type N-terminal cleavage/methylation domain-containing protein [Armatimonadota bacterium]
MRQRAYTLMEIMIAVLIMGVLAAVAIPNFVNARVRARQKTCISNMIQLETAKEQWATENKKSTGDACMLSDIIGPGLHIRTSPSCPAGGTYSVNAVGTKASCTLSAAPELHALP